MRSRELSIIVRLLLFVGLLSVATWPVSAQDSDSAVNLLLNPSFEQRHDVALEHVNSGSAENTKAVVCIDTDVPSVLYNPMIFGGFLEHFNKQVYGGVFDLGSPLSDKRGFRKDVIAALKELKVSVVRWPGGCFVDGYYWQDGVGEKRESKDDIRWGVREPHTFGTHEFVELCRMLDCEPYICNNGNSPIQEMRDWVEYCNLSEGPFARKRNANGYTEPLNVKIWSVGNENYSKAFAQKVRDAAKGMKTVDPDIKVTCPATIRNVAALLNTAGEYLDYISIHAYWISNFQRFQTPDYLTCMMKSDAPEKWVSSAIWAIDQSEYRGRIKISIDEWNLRSWHHPGFPRGKKVDYENPEIIRLVQARDKSLEPSLYTMADALFAASFFNACLRHAEDVDMAAISPLVNTSGPLYVHPKGIVKRTHFHTLAMYANQLKDRVGKLDIKADMLMQGQASVAVVDAIATVDESGKNWAIALVNRHPSKDVACTVNMKNTLLNGRYDVTILTGDSPDAFNDIEHPDRVVPKETQLTFKKGSVDLPPHSLTIITVTVP